MGLELDAQRNERHLLLIQTFVHINLALQQIKWREPRPLNQLNFHYLRLMLKTAKTIEWSKTKTE